MADRLIEALRSGNITEVRAAIEADPKSAKRPRAIVTAAGGAFGRAVQLLHRHGADLNAAWRGYRPLHALLQEEPHAAGGKPAAERLACLDTLLKLGADPELPGAWPQARAIVIAAFVGQPEYVGKLRQAGARIDGFAGAAIGHRELVEEALSEDTTFARARDATALTALQCAAGSRMPDAPLLEIARMLIDAGADIAARTKSWRVEIDAVYLAASAKNKKLFELFLERGADATGALTPALWNGGLDYADLALARAAEPDRAISGGRPLLNDLIRWGQLPQAFWMLEHGASPNISDGRGWTAVHQAASRGNERVWRAVLEAGGDLKRRDKGGDMPLDVAEAMGRMKLLAGFRCDA
jgi:ankyrin repeat protein